MSDNLFLSSAPETDWHRAEPGFVFEPLEVVVPADHQAEKMAACEIDPAVFGGSVDPSFFIGIGIQAGIRNGISAEGNVNMVQQLVQYRPVRLDEVLLVRGSVETVTEVPRGHTVQTSVTFEDRTGRVVMDASRLSLRPDPAKAAARGAGERPPPVVHDPAAAAELAAHRLSPERVKAYSSEGNSIHYDEAAARKSGFRAPMIGGGMGVHYLAAALWATGEPEQIDLSIYFRRPIFWDETFTTAVQAQDAGSAGRTGWNALCLLRDEGDRGLKVLTEARINSLSAS